MGFSAGDIQDEPPGQPLNAAAAATYGDFVMLAYDIFHKPKETSFEVPAGYHLIAYIFMKDFLFFARRRQLYGIIATEDANPHSHILALRGTEGWWEWFDDAVFFPTAFRPVPEAGPVHTGFYRIYRTMVLLPLDPQRRFSSDEARGHVQPTDATFAQQLASLLPDDGGAHHFIVTGHSLGAALCTLYVMEHAMRKLHPKADDEQRNDEQRVIIERVCTFASPRVGTQSFVQRFEDLPIDRWRIANSQDLVPMIPPEIPFRFRHVEESYVFTSENTTKLSPSCWHDMHTYLHFLDRTRQIEGPCAPK